MCMLLIETPVGIKPVPRHEQLFQSSEDVMAERLWEKGESIDGLMHRLTVGSDPLLDRRLVCADCLGSAAHARMLTKVGLLSTQDLEQLLVGLREIYALGKSNSFEIPFELEDVHTAIENRLIESVGEAGRRIHTSRSRNDQIVLAMRLYLRDTVVQLLCGVAGLLERSQQRFTELERIPMPGYTHMQPAMPSSFGMWIHALFEALYENMRDGLVLLEALDSQPLGSAAGFGTSLPSDRAYIAEQLRMGRVQRSFIDVNNSRGRYEYRVLRWCADIAQTLEKFACDCMLYNTREVALLSLPVRLTTGSSIMPQKRNPDVVELLRGRAARVRSTAHELEMVTQKLPSSYHRDLQYTKEPLCRGVDETTAMIQMAGLIIESFLVDETRSKELMHAELYATYEAYRQVQAGKPFRDAYRETAKLVKENALDVPSLMSDLEPALAATAKGMAEAVAEFLEAKNALVEWQSRLGDAVRRTLGVEP
jgi:argininosuccinate lyase